MKLRVCRALSCLFFFTSHLGDKGQERQGEGGGGRGREGEGGGGKGREGEGGRGREREGEGRGREGERDHTVPSPGVQRSPGGLW